MIPPPAASERIVSRANPARFWVSLYDLTARYQWVGAVAGVLLAAALVPVLILAGGYTGPLSPAIPLFFLVPVLVASTLGGRLSGVLVSLVAVAAWDWFFIPPFYLPTISSPRDLLALVVFLCVALLSGQLAGLARHRADDAVRRARTSEALYDLSVALIGSHDSAATLPLLARRLRETFDLRACAILLRDSRSGAWSSAARSGLLPDDLDIERSRNVAGVLAWIGRTGQVCNLGDDMAEVRAEDPAGERQSPRRAQFWPLHVGARLVGVLELVYNPGAQLDPQRDRLLATLVNGAAIALEQERLLREEQEAAVARESDRLKSALLSSVSHDLRTPLAGIKAAASSLLQKDVEWSEDDRRAFMSDIDAEADRLARFVSNLLDLSRIEAGAISPKKEWEDVGELIARVVERLRPQLASRPIEMALDPDLPAACLDVVHIEHALTNLIENAAKYSSPGSPVRVTAKMATSPGGGRELCISVIDRGSGLAPAEMERIFDRFYRVAGSGGPSGTGMGLAIVKGLVEAGGGRVVVESEQERGSTFTVVLPYESDISGPRQVDEMSQEVPYA